MEREKPGVRRYRSWPSKVTVIKAALELFKEWKPDPRPCTGPQRDRRNFAC